VFALVDLDGTVVDRDAAFARWLDLFAEAHGLSPQQRAWVVDWDRRMKERGPFFDGLVEHLRLSMSPRRLWEEYRAAMPGLTPAFPGVEPALRTLTSMGWRLVVLTNGQADNQIGKLRATGLLDLFDGCRVSGQTGLRKPDPDAYLEALSSAAYVGPRGSAWMVGDDPVLDVAGARQVGLATMWISHGLAWPAGRPEPTISVAAPADAFRQLARLTA
jgi:HAD superfamily hydrolase (TIGR01549 family)